MSPYNFKCIIQQIAFVPTSSIKEERFVALLYVHFENDLKLYKSLILAKKDNYMTFYFHCTWHLHTCTIMTGANIHCKTFKILHKYMKHTGIYSVVYLFHSFQIRQTSNLFNRQIRKSFQSICSCVDIHFLYHQIKKKTHEETWNMINDFKMLLDYWKLCYR